MTAFIIGAIAGFVGGTILGVLDHTQILPIYTWIVNAVKTVIGWIGKK